MIELGSLLNERKQAIDNALQTSANALAELLSSMSDITKNIQMPAPPELILKTLDIQDLGQSGVELPQIDIGKIDEETVGEPLSPVIDISEITDTLTNLINEINSVSIREEPELVPKPNIQLSDKDIDTSFNFSEVSKPSAPDIPDLSVISIENFNIAPPERLTLEIGELPSVEDLYINIDPYNLPVQTPRPEKPEALKPIPYSDFYRPDNRDIQYNGTLGVPQPAYKTPAYNTTTDRALERLKEIRRRAEEVLNLDFVHQDILEGNKTYLDTVLNGIEKDYIRKLYKLAHEYGATLNNIAFTDMLARLEDKMKTVQQFAKQLIEAEETALDLSFQYYEMLLRRHSVRVDYLKWAVEYYRTVLAVYEAYYEAYSQYLQLFELQGKINKTYIDKSTLQLEKMSAFLDKYKAEIESYATIIRGDNERLEALRAQVEAYSQFVRNQSTLVEIYNAVNNLNRAIGSSYASQIEADESRINNTLINMRKTAMSVQVDTERADAERNTDNIINRLKLERNRIKETVIDALRNKYSIDTAIETLKLVEKDIKLAENEFKLQLIEKQNNTNVRAMNEAIQRNLSLFERSINSAYSIAENATGVISNYIAGMANSVISMISGIYEGLLEV